MTPEPTPPSLPDPDDANDSLSSLSSARRNPPPSAKRPTEQRGRGGRAHLSDAAQDVILACVVRGENNAEINASLVEAGHLACGQVLSHVTLTSYRRDPRAKVAIDRLSEEAVQAAHVALSDTLVTAVETFRAAKHDLFASPGRFREGLSARDRNSLINALFKAFDHLWDRIGRDDLLANVLRAEQVLVDDLNQRAGLSVEDRKSIENSIKRQMVEMLRQVVAVQGGEGGQSGGGQGVPLTRDDLRNLIHE